MRNGILKATATTRSTSQKELSTEQYVESQIANLLAGVNSKDAASYLLALLTSIEIAPEVLENALDYVADRIPMSVKKKPRRRH